MLPKILRVDNIQSGLCTKRGNKACQVQDLTCSISTNIGNTTVLRKGKHAKILSWYVVRANTVKKRGLYKSIVGNIVTVCRNSQYGKQCGTVHRRIFRSSSCWQDVQSSCLDGQYKLSITCRHRSSRVPSADEIRMLIRYTCPTTNNTHSGSYCEMYSTL